uniref:BY PROTMAP: gi/342321017/gb/EGU12955.1/ Proteophosphoglycan ppg4 [Rhodotorula glutinis ATCC 204091] n=2 Tax=Rhodotorula toruloides TaxID=5286 RepID=A0A0K3CBH1_RHOTO
MAPTPTKPPATAHPIPKLLLRCYDVAHPGSSAFFGTPPSVDQKLKAGVSTVLSRLYPSPDEPPPPIRSVTLILEAFDGVAYTCGSKLDEEHKEVHLSLSYLADVQKNAKSDSNRVANEVMGVLVHELVHAFQFNGKGTVPGGVIEGIADWLRGEAGLAPPHWRERPGEDDRWDAGYEWTGYFLAWLSRHTRNPSLIPQLNRTLQKATWDDGAHLRKLLGGNEPEELWEEYKRSFDGKRVDEDEAPQPVPTHRPLADGGAPRSGYKSSLGTATLPFPHCNPSTACFATSTLTSSKTAVSTVNNGLGLSRSRNSPTMSTAGRINKSGQRFVPKRKNPPPPSGRSARESSVASSTAGPTPKTTNAPLPPLDEDADEARFERGAASGSAGVVSGPSAAKAGPSGSQGRAAASFAPMDPTQSTAASSQPSQSSFGFTPHDPSSSAFTATQATSVFPSQSQPSSPPKSPTRIRPTEPTGTASSSPSRGIAFGPPSEPPVDTSPAREQTSPVRQTSPQQASPVAGPSKRLPPTTDAAAEAGPSSPKRRRTKQKDVQVESAAESTAEAEQDEAEVAQDKGKGKKGRVPAKAKAALAKGKAKGKKAAPEPEAEGAEADGADGGDEEQEEAAPPAKKRKAPATKKKAAPKKTPAAKKGKGKAKDIPVDGEQDEPAANGEGGEGDEEEDDVDEYDKRKPKKRKKAARKPKKGKADAFLFGSDDEDTEAGAEGDEAGAGDEEGEEGAPKKKSAKKAKELPAVDPGETLMAMLADPVPKVSIGRPSERTLFFEQRAKDHKKDRMKAKREKMKKRAKGGEASGDEQDDEQAENGDGGAGGADAEGGASEAGRDGTPAVAVQDKDKGKEKEAAPAATGDDDFFAAMGMRQMEEDDDEGAARNDQQMERSSVNGDGAGSDAGGSRNGDGEEEDGFAEMHYAPQMRIIDGQLVLDEQSLQIDRGGGDQDQGPREVIEESARDRFVNSSTYSKRKQGGRWSKEETELFYDAISQFYTNFEMISLLFPHRTRHEIRRKFNREDRLNPKLVTAALERRKRINMEAIAEITGVDLSGPVPEDPMEKIQRQRAKEEAAAATGHTGEHHSGGRKRKGKKKEEAEDEEQLGGKKKRGKKGKNGAGAQPSGRGFDGDEDGAGQEDEVDEELRRIQEEMEEEERQRRIDEMEAAGLA